MNKMSISRRAMAVLLAVVMLLAVAVPAFAVPNRPSGTYVLDEAGVLSSQTENTLNADVQTLYETTGAELAVVTVNSTGGDIVDFAEDIYSSWNISNAGVLLVLSIEEDDYYALYGAAVTDYFEDDIADILYRYIHKLPSFF